MPGVGAMSTIIRLGRSARAHTIALSAVTSPLWMPWVSCGRERTKAGARPGAARSAAPPAAPARRNWRRLSEVEDMTRDAGAPARHSGDDLVTQAATWRRQRVRVVAQERDDPKGACRMSTHAPLALEQNVAEAVTALARTLYPHVALPDSVYARVAGKLDEAAREDA